MVVHRPKIGVSTTQERGVELDRVQEKQRSIERGQRILELQQEFQREGMSFRSSLPVGASEDQVIRNLEQQLEQRRQQKIQRPRFENVQSQGRAPLGRQIEAGLFGLAAPISPAFTAAGLAGSAVGSAAAGLVVNPEETLDEVRARGGSVFNPVDLAGAASKTAPGPALVGELVGGVGAGFAAAPKTAAKAARGTSGAAKAIRGTFGADTDPGIFRDLPEVKKLIQIIKQAEPVREKTELAKSIELGKRTSKLRERLVRGVGEDDPRLAFKEATSELGGELPRASFQVPEELGFTVEEGNKLLTAVRQGIIDDNITPLDARNLMGTLVKVFANGEVPTRGEISQLAKYFGDDLAEILLKKRPRFGQERVIENIVDTVGIPRSLLANLGIDALRTGRIAIQGGVLNRGGARRSEVFKAFADAWKAGRRAEVARAMNNTWNRDPEVRLLQKFGLEITGTGKNVARHAREETFQSQLADRIPILREFARANTAFFNSLRINVAKGMLHQLGEADEIKRLYRGVVQLDPAAAGGNAARIARTEVDVRQVARLANVLTGRGTVPKSARQYMPLLNQIFFSSRLFIARFETPMLLLSRSPAVRKRIAQDLTKFVGFNIGILTLLDAASDDIEVEWDLRSSDALTLKWGSQRIDLWGGFRSMATLAARLATEETKSGSTGTVYSQSQKDAVLQFLRFKLSPQASAVVDVTTGETALGENLSVDNQVIDRLIPLVAQDIIDGWEVEGVRGGLVGTMSIVGQDTSSYRNASDIIDPLLESSLRINAVDGSGRITSLDDPRLTPSQRAQIFAIPAVREQLNKLSRQTPQDGLAAAREARRTQRRARDESLKRGTMSARVWRNQLLTSRLAAAVASDTRAEIEGRRVARPANDNDRALNGYYDLIEANRVPNENMSFDFDPSTATSDQLAVIGRGFDVDSFSNAVDEYLSSLSKEQRRFVLDNIHADRTPTENLYYQSQELLKRYWEVPDKVISNPRLRALYDQYISMPSNLQAAFIDRNPALKGLVDRIDQQRRRLRLQNRKMDDALVMFYDLAPLHPSNVGESAFGLKRERTRDRVVKKAPERLAQSLGIELDT